jgi:hypothetical protein
MRRIFSGVIGDRGIEPGRAVLGGVAALPESAMLAPAGQMLCNASEGRMREGGRVGVCLGVGWKIEVYACECCRGDNSRKAPTSSERNKEQGHPHGHCFLHTTLQLISLSFTLTRVWKDYRFLSPLPGYSRCCFANSRSQFQHQFLAYSLKTEPRQWDVACLLQFWRTTFAQISVIEKSNTTPDTSRRPPPLTSLSGLVHSR